MAKDLRGFVQSFNISRSRELEQGGVGDGFEAEIEEEMPNKKPKLNKYHATTGGEGDDELQKTFFNSQGQDKDEETREHSATSKWGSHLIQDDKEPITCQATMSMAASKWSNYITQNDMEAVTCQPKKTNVVSKWSSSKLLFRSVCVVVVVMFFPCRQTLLHHSNLVASSLPTTCRLFIAPSSQFAQQPSVCDCEIFRPFPCRRNDNCGLGVGFGLKDIFVFVILYPLSRSTSGLWLLHSICQR